MPQILEFIKQLIQTYGAFGVFLSGLIEEVIAPIPSFAVAMATGFSLLPTDAGTFEFVLRLVFIVALPLSLGMTLGSVFTYSLGYFVGKPVVDRWGRFLGFDWNDLEKMEKKLTEGKADEIMLLGLRVVPLVPLAAVNFFSGSIRYPIYKYLSITFFGSLVRNCILALIGWQAGEIYTQYAKKFELFEEISFGAAILLAFAFWIYKKKRLGCLVKIFKAYKNTLFFLLALVLAFYLQANGAFHLLAAYLGRSGLLGSAVAGMFFVSVFTAAPAFFILYDLAGTFGPVQVSIFAGFGSMLGDYLIFSFFQDRLIKEWKPWLKSFFGPKLARAAQSRRWRWVLPLLGAIIIASPLPDEIGISLIGVSKIKRWQFLLLAFLLNSAGLFLLLESALVIAK